MTQPSALRSLLFLLSVSGICAGFEHENCKNYDLQFDRVFSVPGDAAMLNSTLVSPEVFNFTSVPYNISWYDPGGQEMSDQSGRVLVSGGTLWFLDLKMQDSGDYVSIVRTPSKCFRQATKLVVERPVPGECGRPRKALQTLTNMVTEILHCPLRDYISKLDSYNVSSHITWYRGCERIVDGTNRYTYLDRARLKIDGVERNNNNSSYTCSLSFTLGGTRRSVSETIEALVSEKYSLAPQVHEPANETIKAPFGSNFSKRCRMFVPCVGKPHVDIFWRKGDISYILKTTVDQIYSPKQRTWKEDVPITGVWLERVLIIPELGEEDFNINYTCLALSYRGISTSYFTLLPEDPNIIVPIGSALGGMMVLFIVSIVTYYVFKLDIVLWFRRTFPVLYTNTDGDGKSYDAYVAYPQPCALGFSKQVEAFALCTLPQVLEKACGYKLFIAGRDCMPGTAVVDSVEENIQASRRLLLIYTAATFTGKRHASSTSSNNNNDISQSGGEDAYSDTRQQLECVTAMHRALLERSLKVILVELEPISPAQLALFPESVRHLRKKQGAVRWWKNPRGRTSGDEETGGPDKSLSPSSRFWKEMRYRMPVRGKRGTYPEKTALLSL